MPKTQPPVQLRFDYWVLDLKHRQLHLFRQPTPDGYQSEVILAEDAIISPLPFPSCTITVSELLPPVIESNSSSRPDNDIDIPLNLI